MKRWSEQLALGRCADLKEIGDRRRDDEESSAARPEEFDAGGMLAVAVPTVLLPLVLIVLGELRFIATVEVPEPVLGAAAAAEVSFGPVLAISLSMVLWTLTVFLATASAPMVLRGLRLLVILGLLLVGWGTKGVGAANAYTSVDHRTGLVLSGGETVAGNGRVPRVSVVNPDVYEAFRHSGVREDLARAAAEAIPDRNTVATKLDLKELETNLTKSLTGRFLVIMTVFVAMVGVLLTVGLLFLRPPQ